jgi:hypothetical protein
MLPPAAQLVHQLGVLLGLSTYFAPLICCAPMLLPRQPEAGREQLLYPSAT